MVQYFVPKINDPKFYIDNSWLENSSNVTDRYTLISRLNTPLLKVWDLPQITYYSLSFITINVQSYFPYILFNVYNVLIYNRVALHSLKFTGRVLAPCIEELNWREWTFLTIFLFHIKIFLFIYLVSLTRVKLLWVSLPIFFY